MADATCKTCPNIDAGFCHLSPPDDRHGSMPWPRCDDDGWCAKHPVRVAAYEAAVQRARSVSMDDALRGLREELAQAQAIHANSTATSECLSGAAIRELSRKPDNTSGAERYPDASWSEGVEPER